MSVMSGVEKVYELIFILRENLSRHDRKSFHAALEHTIIHYEYVFDANGMHTEHRL